LQNDVATVEGVASQAEKNPERLRRHGRDSSPSGGSKSGAPPAPTERPPTCPYSNEPAVALLYILSFCRLSFRYSMWLGFVGWRGALVGLWFALSGFPRFNCLVGLRFALSGFQRFTHLIGSRFGLSGFPRFNRFVGSRFALSRWTDLSGSSPGFQPFDTPGVLFFPMPALLPAFPVMPKLMIGYPLVVPWMPSPTMLPVISPPTCRYPHIERWNASIVHPT
jgi:hypothetical protein